MEIFVDLIANVGFPIACVFCMFFMWNKEQNTHAEESRRYSDAIENNTQVIFELREIMQELLKNVRN